MPAAISVPGANGALGAMVVRGAEPSLPSAAGSVHAASRFEPVGRPRNLAARAAPRPKSASAGGVALNVLNAITHDSWRGRSHVGTLRNTPPWSDPLRTVTLPPSSDGRDHPAPQRRVAVDAAADQALEVVAALRMADENKAAPGPDPAQERVERLGHVAVGGAVVAGGRRARLQRGHGGLPVHRGVDAAQLRVTRRLIVRDRAKLGVNPLGREARRLVGHGRVDVEAGDAVVGRALGRDAPSAHIPALEDRRAQPGPARVVLHAGAA